MDLEFLVQFLCLAEAAAHPAVVNYSDNIRQLEGLAEAGVLEAAEAERLTTIYLEYRGWLHRRDLDLKDGVPEDARFEASLDWVGEQWAAHLGSA